MNGNLLADMQTYQGFSEVPRRFRIVERWTDCASLSVLKKRYSSGCAHDRNTTDAEISYYLVIAYEARRTTERCCRRLQEAMRYLPIARRLHALAKCRHALVP